MVPLLRKRYESESTPIPLTPSTPPSGGLRHPASWPPRTRLGSYSPAPSGSALGCTRPRCTRIFRARPRCACTHSDFTMPIRDSIAVLSHGEDIEPIDGRISCSRMVLDSSSDTYWARGPSDARSLSGCFARPGPSSAPRRQAPS